MKMSPLSDTTNLAPIAAGSNLYEHIGHMFYTTVPATIVSLIVYAIAGMNANVSAGASSETVTAMLAQLDTMFNWNILLLPWSAAGAYMASTLGVETLEYLPWAVLCYTGFVFAIIWGFTGFGIAKLKDEEK